MHVQNKHSNESWVIEPESFYEKELNKIRSRIDNFPLNLYQKRTKKTYWGLSWVPHKVANSLLSINPDIIHLNWVSKDFVPIKEIKKFKKPIVWTLHDSWVFTGGCHVTYGCERFVDGCGKCPQLGSISEFDISRWTWRRKKKHWRNSDITIVSPSRWLANEAARSPILAGRRIEVIPHGLDVNIFKPIDKKLCRQILNIGYRKKVILFGAMNALHDENKGFQLLLDSLRQLVVNKPNDYELIIFGSSDTEKLLDIEIPTKLLGTLSDDSSLAVVYSAADVMCVPSRYEAFGQTATEALACGTPVVAFATTGLLDIIDHKKNGYLAKPYETVDYTHGIEWVLSNDKRLLSLSKNARIKAEHFFNINNVAQKYITLYQDLLDNRNV